ncbi:unnamed protein product, partial [Heterosigma akashiwo]
QETRIVAPALPRGKFRLDDGTKVKPPEGWALLKPGDAGLTRRVKAAGPTWTVQAKKRGRTVSLGVWAPAETIERLTAHRGREKASPAYQRKLAAGRARRAKEQEGYAREFRGEVRRFLAFAPRHRGMAGRLAEAVAAHATPVGSGTVARTKRLGVDRRAEKAVVAWLRHKTTAYDSMR